MYKYIRSFFALLLPILGKAVTRAIVDEAVNFAYKDEPKRMSFAQAKAAHPSNGVNRIRPRTMEEVDILERERIERVKSEQFHDVLMVAFDITGPNVEVVKQFLYNYMPICDDTIFQGHRINLDSFWIADDTAGDSDCDSAVFVSKGNQEAARGLLREHGLV